MLKLALGCCHPSHHRCCKTAPADAMKQMVYCLVLCSGSVASKTFELTEVDTANDDHDTLMRQYGKEAFAGSTFATELLMQLDAPKVSG